MAAQEFTLTKEYLQKLFEYKDGQLYWKNHAQLKNKLAGGVRSDGYRSVQISLGKGIAQRVLLHRAIFLMHYGYLPEIVDHIDRDKTNNRIENLRGCTHQENLWNQPVRKKNSSGYKGVYWNKKNKKWIVYVSVDRKLKSFGSYDDLNKAIEIAEKARKQHRGTFA